MSTDKKRDPDAILAQIEREKRGRLTLFLGAAAGVGKTYAMLEAARERLSEGVDLVAGWVETHGRAETRALLEGLPAVEPRYIMYHGRQLAEMDLGGILARKPELVLVDELAHSNVPGARHPRRYLDVEELLQAGISVYTTLNIQHLESLNDSIKQITGITVRETVPDRFMERADQIQLIDIPVEELITRLKEGKVYVPDMAERALANFFRPGNINALRELALRQAASRVDQQMEEYRQLHGIDIPWPAGDRIMACISSSPFGVHVLRAASRMAVNLRSELLAVYIDKPRYQEGGGQVKENLMHNLQLAEDLGARVITATHADIADSILSIARKENVSHIVLGKPLRPRWLEMVQGSVVDDIVRGSRGVSVHIIPGEPENQAVAFDTRSPRTQFRLLHYLVVCVMIAVTAMIGVVGGEVLGLTNIGMLFLLPVLYGSARLGLKPSIFAAIAGVLVFDVLFVPPIFRLAVDDVRYIITFAVFLVVAITTSTLADRLRYRAHEAIARENMVRTLYDLAKEITAVTDIGVLGAKIVEHVAQALDAEVVLLMPDMTREKLLLAASSNPGGMMAADQGERAVADWSYHKNLPAGRGTDTLPGAYGFYLPLNADDERLGVLGIRSGEKLFSPEQSYLLQALAGLAALAIGRLKLAAEAQEIRDLEASERLRTALFNSISHDMRTPLSAIIAAVSSLIDEGGIYSPDQQQVLMESIRKGALRMNRVVSNLLDLARIESGLMRLQLDWHDMEDIVGVALRENFDTLADFTVKIDLEDNLPLVKIDYALIEQVLANLLDNAAKYSESGSEIRLTVSRHGQEMLLAVYDEGSGVAEGQEDVIFNKFYRLQSPYNVSGTGLGLSICKGIIEAHGGRIWFENRPEGGGVVSISLPLEESIALDVAGVPEGGLRENGSQDSSNRR